MKRNRLSILNPLLICGSTVVLAAVMTNVGWAQLVPPVPAVPDVVKDATDTAQDAVQDTTNTAQDAVKDVEEAAQDTQRDATKATQDTAKDLQNTAKDLQRDTTKAAQDATKDVQDTARDVQRDTTKAAQDAARDVKNSAKDVQRNATRSAQDAARNTQDAARDLKNDATKAARDAGQNARDAARDATDDVQDAARDASRTTRDAARDATNARTNVRTQGSISARGQANMRAADLGVWFDRSTTNGLIVADVATNAALAAAGFREGDRIVSVAGQNVATEADFVRYLSNANARGRMNIIVLRDGQQQTLYIDPTGLSQTTTVQLEPLEVFGVIPDDRYNDRIVVWRVVPRSPAYYAGIRAGDIITSFANRPVATLQALAQLALQTRAGTIPIQVTRSGRTRVIQADFPEIQVSGNQTTTFRQNLDAELDANVNANTPAAAPTIQTEPRRYEYYGGRRAMRRARR